MDAIADGNPNLPGVKAFFKLFTMFPFIPFKLHPRGTEFRRHPSYVLCYWALVGPFFTVLHTVSALASVFETAAVFTTSTGHGEWRDMKALFGLALANILVQTNIFVAAFGVSIIKNYDEVLHVCNQMFRVRSNYKDMGAVLPKDVPVLKPFVLLYILRIYGNISLCFSHPEKPLFLYWVIPSQWKTTTAHNVYMLINAFYACTYWSTLMFTLIVIVLFVETSVACLQFRCRQRRWSLQRAKMSYLELLVLLRMFENAFGRLALPVYMSCGSAVLTIGNYGVVRFCGRVDFKLYISFFSPFLGNLWVFSSLFWPAALMKLESEDLRRKMWTLVHSKHGRRRYERAALRSLPNLSLRIGSLFTVEKTTRIVVLGFVAVNSMTLLITL